MEIIDFIAKDLTDLGNEKPELLHLDERLAVDSILYHDAIGCLEAAHNKLEQVAKELTDIATEETPEEKSPDYMLKQLLKNYPVENRLHEQHDK